MFDVTRTGEWHTLFLLGTPPQGITASQWQSLQELASIHSRRQQERRDSHNPNLGNFAGGWHLSARAGEFEKLHNIAAGILAHDYKALQDYRSQ